MEQAITMTARSKEPSGSSIQCPMLTSTNYTVWTMRMKVTLKVNRVWETIDPGTQDSIKNDLATALLYQSIPEGLILQLGEQDSAKCMWDAIKSRYLGAERVREARLQTLTSEFEALMMRETEKIEDFAGRLSSLASKSAALGQVIDENKMVKKFLNGLSRNKFIHLIASLEQVLDLNATGFEDIVGRLKAYEERIGGVGQGDDQSKLLFTSSSPQVSRGGNNGSRGRGRGNRGRGRGRGRFNTQGNNSGHTPNNEKTKKDHSRVVCWHCEKLGHFANKCPEKPQTGQGVNLVDTEEADAALYMHEIILLSEKDVLPSKYKDENDEQSTWYLDNGASNHMTGNKSYFSELNESIRGKVKFGDESCIDIKGKGSIIFQAKTGEQRLMKDIYWIPDLKSNIISLGQATEDGCDVRLRQNYLTIHDQERILLMKVFRSPNRMYKIRLIIGTPVSLLAKLDDETWRWHARLGHVNFDSMITMSKRKLVHGLPSFGEEKQICEGCLVGKQRRQSFPHATKFRASHKLELIHGDLCGPISPPTTVGNRYVFVLIDDFSRYMWSILLKEKSEAFEKFKTFKSMVESETGVKIKMFRTDRGGEFTSIDFQTFCENSGISRQLTAPYSPQQNGVVERRNRTLMEMTRSMLKTMKMPNYLWGEAVRHATYLINRVSTKALSDQTPYELFKNHKPNLAHLRVFGCKAYAKVEKVNMKKLDDRSRPLVHLGTEPGSKAYRLYDPTNKRIHVSRDVVFDESNGWSWNETVQGLVDKPGMFQLSFGDYGNHGIEGDNVEDATDNAIDRSDEVIDQSGDVINQSSSGGRVRSFDPNVIVRSEDVIDRSETEQSMVTLRRSSRERNLPKRLEDYLLMADLIGEELLLSIDGEPSSYQEARDFKEWMEAMCAELESINKNKTWELVNKPSNVKPIGLKWVFKIKKNSDGSINKHKARLVAKGYVQRHGVDFDEVYAPVARIETIRFLFALAATSGWEIHHLDVKTAFLHGELKELVYVYQPDGFEKKGEEQKVYKLHKALYGLRQAPRAWNTKLDQILKGMKFVKCSKEQSVYRKTENEQDLIVAIYVDDLFVTGTTLKIIQEFKQGMSSKFEMSDLGKLTYYLGIEVLQNSNGITLKQESYAEKIIKEAGMESCNRAHIPMEPSLKLSKAEDEEEIDATNYRKIVGCLRYLLHTRPDLSYAVGVLSRYMQSPRTLHGAAMKHVLRYLQGTKSYGLNFKRNGDKKLVGYSDSSHDINKDDGKSTAGHIFYFGSSPITWCSQKQPTVALSSCEAEFMAATAAACQAIWLQDLLHEVTGWNRESITLRVDNKSAIALTKNPVFHGRSKHIHKRYHFIRECVENEQVNVEHVSGEEQRADILTKPLARIKFTEMRSLVGVEDLLNPSLGIKGDNVR